MKKKEYVLTKSKSVRISLHLYKKLEELNIKTSQVMRSALLHAVRVAERKK